MYMHHDSPSACACTTLRKASRAVTRVYDEALADFGMTTAQFSILRYIARGEPLALSRLAEQLVMDRSSLYRAIGPIERHDWVRIEAGPGRAKLARLTEAGRAALRAAEPAWEKVQQRVEEQMGSLWSGLELALRALTRSAERVGGRA